MDLEIPYQGSKEPQKPLPGRMPPPVAGEWITHSGGPCPVSNHEIVTVRRRDGSESTGHADNFHPWTWTNSSTDKIAYKIVGDVNQTKVPQPPAEPAVFRRRAEQPIAASEFLQRGIGHMRERASTYDKPEGERSMAATVASFNAMSGHQLTEEQGWLFLVCLKAVRSQQGKFKSDNYEDGAAYFGLMGECASKDTSRK